jgi:hypothetical protein
VSPFFACAVGTPTQSAPETAIALNASEAPNALQPTVVPFASQP